MMPEVVSRRFVIRQPPPSTSVIHSKKVVVCSVIFAILAVLTAVIVIPMSFSYLEYYEYGFKQQKSTGKVWLENIYTGKRYFLGPDYNFLVYPADSQPLDLIKIDVFTKDKLEVALSAHMQYFLRKDELTLLHKTFNVYFDDVMKTSAVDALKGAIPIFTTRELIQNRSSVEKVLHSAVRQRLGGECCRPDCSQYGQACPEGCKPVPLCTDKDKGLHADVVHFQLGKYYIPSPVETRYMEALVLQETTLREQLLQNASVVRKETQAIVKEIKNQAREITSNATAKANLITRVANADYRKSIEEARIIGLARCLSSLNITDEEKKISFDYLRALLDNGKVRLNINFDQLIAGKL
ncbi:uncharacterized protein LOC123529441 [Mercenaria mercenaria]|uniref:uncharacterized protein LOC123529441 n=1 Tax=Mercenaria mercenaria TaxID=6596 RepID=UPI001E1DF778|nr:uncharacterized protein LOC123529441 [Mercenaria mercenaria]XP_045165706.1 uncharacterized protein LOC123529441 [Mercenaria mercenaria]